MGESSPPGSILFEVENVRSIGVNQGRNSEKIEVGGLSWKLIVEQCLNPGRQPYFFVLLVLGNHDCSNANGWSITVDGEIRLRGRREISRQYNKVFSSQRPMRSRYVHNWDYVMNEKNGFLTEKGSIIVEFKFQLTSMTGFRKEPRFDFTNDADPLSDIELIIDGEKIYANKAILASHSDVFKAMFFGNFVEKEKKSIELKDIDRKGFNEMLRVIYPSRAKITDESYSSLLSIADRFQITVVMNEVEDYLIKADHLGLPERLKLSDKWRLAKLQHHCLDSFTRIEEITQMKGDESYYSLSSSTKSALMDQSQERSMSSAISPVSASLSISSEDASIHEGAFIPIFEVFELGDAVNGIDRNEEKAGVNWRLGMRKQLEGGIEYFTASLSCSANLTIEGSFELDAIDNDEIITREFNESSIGPDSPIAKNLSTWANLTRFRDVISKLKADKNGLIKEFSSFILTAKITVVSIPQSDPPSTDSFFDCSDPRNDVAFVINGRKVYANRGIPSIHSSVFNAMFYGEFKEKNEKEIELKEIDYEEFIEFLQFIYPTGATVKDGNAESLMKLGDRFQVKSLTKAVEKYLIDSATLPIGEKMKIADYYNRQDLLIHCLDSIKTIADDPTLIQSLSKDVKAKLCERILAIV